MKLDMILSGVGGQGILSISYLICNASLDKGLNFKQAEVHGMAQRGGAVQSHLRISDQPIASDLVPQGGAQLILSVEPLEVFRYLSYFDPEGQIVTSTVPYKNISNYPDESVLMEMLKLLPKKILIDAKSIAQDIGNIKTQNMVILGAGAPFLHFSADDFDSHIEKLFSKKSEKIVKMNKDAIRAGYEIALAGGN
jgi:indolepyruvate ferredoxin oxidoreductase, beta subunit